MSVVCHTLSTVGRQQLPKNDISETIRHRFIGMNHCLVNLYQIHLNGVPGVENVGLANGPIPSLFKEWSPGQNGLISGVLGWNHNSSPVPNLSWN